MNMLNEPIDALHLQCIDLRDLINREFTQAKERAAKWTPRPEPKRAGR